jgi:hypothetical protein
LKKVTVTPCFFGENLLILLIFFSLCDIYLNMRQKTAQTVPLHFQIAEAPRHGWRCYQAKTEGFWWSLRSKTPTNKTSMVIAERTKVRSYILPLNARPEGGLADFNPPPPPPRDYQ